MGGKNVLLYTMELARRRNAFAMCFYEPLYTRRRVVGIELW